MEPSASDRILTVPNALSLLRLLGVPVFLWLVLVPEADLAAFVLLVVAGSTDWFDGYLARALDQAGALDLDEALKTLNETERVCVSLCHGAGMSHPEIAAAMNLPLGTVKSHVKRGLDKLRARLQPAQASGGRSAHVG